MDAPWTREVMRMAQEVRPTAGRKLRALLRRFGLSAKGSIAVAGVLLIAIVGILSSVAALSDGAISVERKEEQRQEQQTQGNNTQPSDEHQDAPREAETTSSNNTASVVHVDGAVVSPGVYAIEGSGKRVNDAVERAGGLLPDADTSALNLAAPLADGQKIHIPLIGEADSHPIETPTVDTESKDAGGSALVNINTASETELCELPGVGEATASAIIEERTQGGPFVSPEDIMRVSGIGEKKFAKLEGHICV